MDCREERVMSFFEKKGLNEKQAKIAAASYWDAFDAMMEGAAMMLDFIGEISYTYVTKSSNTVRVRLDSP